MTHSSQLRALPWGKPDEEGKEGERKPLMRTLDWLPPMRMDVHRTTPWERKPRASMERSSQGRSTVS